MGCESVEEPDFDESLVAAFEQVVMTFPWFGCVGGRIASGGSLKDRAAIPMSHDAPMVVWQTSVINRAASAE
jgi:hypothetical protein